jgi:hypothetical protein
VSLSNISMARTRAKGNGMNSFLPALLLRGTLLALTGSLAGQTTIPILPSTCGESLFAHWRRSLALTGGAHWHWRLTGRTGDAHWRIAGGAHWHWRHTGRTHWRLLTGESRRSLEVTVPVYYSHATASRTGCAQGQNFIGPSS